MNKEQVNFNKNCYSIAEYPGENPGVIYQPSQEMHLHQVPQGYQILSRNDFNKVKKRINFGIFNKKTNFLVGEEKSLLVWDNQESVLCSPNTSELIKEKSRYFMIYDMNFIIDNPVKEIEIFDKTTEENLEVQLNKQFGNDIGIFLKRADPQSDVIPNEFHIMRSIIQLDNGKMSINKQVLINSNPNFLLGILEGYIQDNNQLILQHNINIYNITYILNLLGAQYSIRSLQNGEKQVRFKLPQLIRKMTSLKDIFFRIYKYKFSDGALSLTKNENLDIVNLENELTFQEIVNSGLIEMIPIKDLHFEPVENEVMYDLTMTSASATNYSLPGTPVLKNSDGDVLGAVAIMTKDAAEECIRKFSVEFKVNFLNLNSGTVNNWGVMLDSQLALYSATM